ncbi:NAD-dependent epimerase/dehydratase family protein [Paenibacillus arenosi]|uniref:NAD-dependent epimerase/dehydratase family protein n=1 Tax=Paenibacillus arenosi TaxID=2774142 RepID=A0ABR9B2Q5_9BACL|nr:NAD-dependent epimerase/dehydratase family protein [Paenibacillus arenosi]MBD8500273.1 NAD-dependent epimerase/dehydratase family protein [Paenibacillus arenosi]
MKDASIVVTGASGFTGVHACQTLAALGMKVTAFVRRRVSFDSTLSINQIEVDILKPKALRHFMQQVSPQYVLHLAGMNAVQQSWRAPAEAMHINMLGTVHVLESVREFPDTRVLVITSKLKSAPAASSSNLHPYAISKWFQEQAALAWSQLYPMHIMMAEPSNLIGPGPSTGICALLGNYVARCERGEPEQPFTFSSRADWRDYLDVRDAVAAYAHILQNGANSRIYRVESGRVRALEEVSEVFQNMATATIPYQWKDTTPLAEFSSMSSKSTESSGKINNDQEEVLPVLESWGWKPKYSFTESVADILNYFRQLRR